MTNQPSSTTQMRAEKAEANAVLLRNILDKMHDFQIAPAKLQDRFSKGHTTLARNIRVAVTHGKPADGPLLTVSLPADIDQGEPAKRAGYYREFKDFVENIEKLSGLIVGRTRAIDVKDSETQRVDRQWVQVEISLTNADSDQLRQRLAALKEQVDNYTKRKGLAEQGR